MDEPDDETRTRALALLGWSPRSWLPVIGGYTPARRYVVADGERRAFVKVATNLVTARMLRAEGRAYERISGPFVPHFFGWEDHPQAPMLAIESLEAARWPPPWDAALVAEVRSTIEAMGRAKAELPRFAEAHTESWSGWAAVATDPTPFLSLDMASAGWLKRALPTLVAAEAGCPLDGEALTHFDLRSDNICLTADGVKFVDWSGACIGNPALDLGGWLPSLAFEGGPMPEAVVGHAPEVAARVSGYFAERAGLPQIPDAPFVRRVQREQLSTALPWAARALGLPPPNAN